MRFLLPVFIALALPACIIVTDPDDDGAAEETGSGEDAADVPACGDPGTFSSFDDAGNCVCEEGLVWCTDAPDDFNCCLPACGDPGTNSQITQDDQCECIAGYAWCTEDPDDVNCCEA